MDTLEQFFYADLQCPCNLPNVGEADILPPTLNSPDISPVQSCKLGQFFLRPTTLFPKPPHCLSKLQIDVGHGGNSDVFSTNDKRR